MTASVSKRQALRERWALVLAKLAAWWSASVVARWPWAAGLGGWLLGFVALAVLCLVYWGAVAALDQGARRAGVAVHVPTAPEADGGAPVGALDLQDVDRVLMDLDRRLVALERSTAAGRLAGGQVARRGSVVAPVSAPAASGDFEMAGPAAPTGRAGEVWGETDLDRAIKAFSPPQPTSTP